MACIPFIVGISISIKIILYPLHLLHLFNFTIYIAVYASNEHSNLIFGFTLDIRNFKTSILKALSSTIKIFAHGHFVEC